MRRVCVAIIALACLWFPSSVMRGQQQGPDPYYDAKGFQPGHDYFSPLPFEHIDTTTGNVYLRFANLVWPGNAGFDLRFEWSYNSKDMLWDWGIAGIPMAVSPTVPTPVANCQEPDPNGPSYFMPTLFGSDGAEHGTLWTDVGDTGDDLLTSSFWKYHHPTRTLRLENGLVATYDRLGPFGTCGMFSASITHLEDPFGNTVVFETTEGRLTTIKQSLGNDEERNVTLGYNEAGVLASLSAEGRTWQYEYENDPNDRPRLHKIIPPEGPAWQFDYPADGYDLTKVTTPNGGTVEYEFGIHHFLRDLVGHPGIFIPTKVITKRTTGGRAVTEGVWTFSFSSIDDNELTMDGPGSQTLYRTGLTGAGHPVHSFRSIKVGGIEIQRESVGYGEVIITPRAEPEYKIPLIEARAITRSGVTYTTDYQYRGAVTVDYGRPDYGMPSRIVEDGDVDRTTDITYEHLLTPYILRRPSVVTTTVNGETLRAATRTMRARAFARSRP